jgi:hypothetical protein
LPKEAVITRPYFTGGKDYFGMFMDNFGNAKGNLFERYKEATKKTPTSGEVGIVLDYKTTKSPKEAEITASYALKGKIPDYLKDLKALQENAANILSEKHIQTKSHGEEEAALRTTTEIPRDSFVNIGVDIKTGDLVPLIERGGIVTRAGNIFYNERVEQHVIKADADFISKQEAFYSKFGLDLLNPKEHTLSHQMRVAENVPGVVNLLSKSEKNQLIDIYGSLPKAVKEIQKGALRHDVGKYKEGSIQMGKQHGEVVYDVWKELQNNPKMVWDKFPFRLRRINNLKPRVALAIKYHDIVNPRSLNYKFNDLLGRITPEQKVLSTADRLDLPRMGAYNIKVDVRQLPVKAAIGLVPKEFVKPRESFRNSVVDFGKEAVGKLRSEKTKDTYYKFLDKVSKDVSKGYSYRESRGYGYGDRSYPSGGYPAKYYPKTYGGKYGRYYGKPYGVPYSVPYGGKYGGNYGRPYSNPYSPKPYSPYVGIPKVPMNPKLPFKLDLKGNKGQKLIKSVQIGRRMPRFTQTALGRVRLSKRGQNLFTGLESVR